MTAEPSPRPWRVNSVTGGHISDAKGNPVCFCVGSNCGERARLIVDAVNERDKLRDYARRLADLVENLLAFYEYRTRDHQPSKDFVMHQREFLFEVRKEIRRTKPGLAPAASAAGKEGV